jgi:hypothetical protein
MECDIPGDISRATGASLVQMYCRHNVMLFANGDDDDDDVISTPFSLTTVGNTVV